MSIAHALAALFGGDTQTQIAQRLTAAGVPVEQTRVSRWLRGVTVPTLDDLAQIEAAYSKPRGWLLATAGLIDVRALSDVEAVSSPSDARTAEPELAARVATLSALLDEVLAGAVDRSVQVKQYGAEMLKWAARVSVLEAQVVQLSERVTHLEPPSSQTDQQAIDG